MIFFHRANEDYRSICISTLARRTVQESRANHLGGDHGYFIYEIGDRPNSGGILDLVKAAPFDAVFRPIGLWRERNRRRVSLEHSQKSCKSGRGHDVMLL
jgi:hypothetical protein